MKHRICSPIGQEQSVFNEKRFVLNNVFEFLIWMVLSLRRRSLLLMFSLLVPQLGNCSGYKRKERRVMLSDQAIPEAVSDGLPASVLDDSAASCRCCVTGMRK